MKLLARMVAIVGIAAFSWEAQAADWFNIYSQELKVLDTPIWAAADQTAESPVADVPRNSMLSGNDYWIVTGFKVAGKTASGTLKSKISGGKDWTWPTGSTLNIGSPSTSRFGKTAGSCRFMIGDYQSANGAIRWYNGTLDNSQTHTGARYLTLNGPLAVEQVDADSTHVLQQKSAAGSEALTPIKVPAKISGMSPDAVISCASTVNSTMEKLLAAAGYYEFTGDNGSYNGSFALNSAYRPVILGGTQTLGNPEVPNPAALTICDNGAFAVGSNSSSPTRGIRLDGETAYLAAWASSCSGFTLGYPVSRKSDVAGALVKVGPGTVTLDAAYTAGDIEVSSGTLVIGANATLPAGQKIVVKDGATLKCVYNLNIDYTQVTITTEGTGTVTYDDGYRLNNGVWEVSVTMAAEGDGTVDATAWELPGTTVTRTATAGADAFIGWKGDLAALVDRDPFATTVRVRVEKPLALTAMFGSLAPPEDVTCPDGTTFVFADRTMTVTVPADVVSTYDYAAKLSSGYVTSIVKKGAGDLTLAVTPDYVGDFTVSEGRIVVTAVGALGHDDIGTVTVADGAALVNRYVGNDASSGKLFHIAGTGYVDCIDNNSYCPISGTFVLDGDATFYSGGPSRRGLGFHRTTFDLNGHELTFSEAKWNAIVLTDVLFTNRSDQVSKVKSSGNSLAYTLTRVTFAGGAQNQFVPGSATLMINSVTADWTLLQDSAYTLTLKTPNVATTGNCLDHCWDGPVSLSRSPTSGQTVDIGDPSDSVSALTFGGSVVSVVERKPLRITGFCNILDSANFKKGATLLPGNTTLRTGLYLWNGATGFTCDAGYAIWMFGTDLWMDDATAFAVGSLVCTNDCRILGGPLGNAACGRAMIAGITQADPNGEVQTLTIDSSAKIGPSLVTSKLALAPGKTADELPLFDDVGFADGAVFDMQGNDLTVTGLTGFPTVANPGALTITGTWTIDQTDILAGKCLNLGGKALTFADGAKIVIVNRTTSSQQSFVIAQTTGGIFGSPVTQGWRRDVEIRDGKLTLTARGVLLIVR